MSNRDNKFVSHKKAFLEALTTKKYKEIWLFAEIIEKMNGLLDSQHHVTRAEFMGFLRKQKMFFLYRNDKHNALIFIRNNQFKAKYIKNPINKIEEEYEMDLKVN